MEIATMHFSSCGWNSTKHANAFLSDEQFARNRFARWNGPSHPAGRGAVVK
jgi:hypothetical protein